MRSRAPTTLFYISIFTFNLAQINVVNMVAASLIGSPDFYKSTDATRKTIIGSLDMLLTLDPEFVLKVLFFFFFFVW